jgi:hypothetical protein
VLLQEPQVNFELIKAHYPHFMHKRAKSGHCVYFEQLGKIQLAPMKERGVTLPMLLRHYQFITEFLWKHVDPSETVGVGVRLWLLG